LRHKTQDVFVIGPLQNLFRQILCKTKLKMSKWRLIAKLFRHKKWKSAIDSTSGFHQTRNTSMEWL